MTPDLEHGKFLADFSVHYHVFGCWAAAVGQSDAVALGFPAKFVGDLER